MLACGAMEDPSPGAKHWGVKSGSMEDPSAVFARGRRTRNVQLGKSSPMTHRCAMSGSMEDPSAVIARGRTMKCIPKDTNGDDPVAQAYASQDVIWTLSSESNQRTRSYLVKLLGPMTQAERRDYVRNHQTWKTSTRASYWATWLGVNRNLKLLSTPEDQELMRILQQEANSQIDAIHPIPLSMTDFLTLTQLPHVSMTTKVAIATTFLLGQRMSDMLLLRPQDIADMTESVAITLHAGKVVPKIGPYSLFIPKTGQTSLLAEMILTMSRSETSSLFAATSNTEIRDALRAVNCLLELRSVRRGGLIAMAENNTHIATILTFSRHASEAMLYRYLNAGRSLKAVEVLQSNVLANTTQNAPINLLLQRSLAAIFTAQFRYSKRLPSASTTAYQYL